MPSASVTTVNVANGHAAKTKVSVKSHKKSSSSSSSAAAMSSRQNSDRRASEKYKHTFAVHHKSRASLFSQEVAAAPSSLGFRNLMGLVIVVSNLRLMVENFKKYGMLVTLSGVSIPDSDWQWFWTLWALTPCHLFVAYLIELAASRYATKAVALAKKSSDAYAEQKRQEKVFFSRWMGIALAHGFNATFMLAFATFVVYYGIHNPGLGTIAEIHAVVVWLKVCSYAFTNRDLRHALLNPDPADSADLPAIYRACPYPRNVNFGNLCYFWWAPTLVYQPVYPRSERIRWDYIVRRVCEFALLCALIWIVCAQYAVPLMRNSLDDIAKLHGLNILERVMKLSTISVVCWLAGFFALFQSFLNALAEITRFGDREFYGDWWNTTTLRSYWTSWNKPVTHFMKRHIYAPMVGRGVPPLLAQMVTFFFSGVLHELLIGVPTHNILGIAFAGMMFQWPLIVLTDQMQKWGGNGHNVRLAGNLTFWISFCMFGQPVAALMYFFAWQAKYGDAGTRPQWPELSVMNWNTTKAFGA